MIGIDGMPVPQSFYIERSLRQALVGAKRLTLRSEQTPVPQIEMIVAAAARPFVDSLQTEQGLHELRVSNAPYRF